MDYRRLGASGLKVSPICLGTLTFGERTDAREAKRMLDRARDTGVNFVDTADVYADGRSEDLLGRLIKGDRDRWVVATKVGIAAGPDPNRRGHGRQWLERAILASLRRLKTDYVDVYYLHWLDAETPFEETAAALGDLVRRGLVRYWGVSNYRGWQIAELVRAAERVGTPRPIAAQPNYNILHREAEVEYIPACAHYGLGVVPYSPIARGVLTGKYLDAKRPERGSRAADAAYRATLAWKVMERTDLTPAAAAAVRKVVARAERLGVTPAQFATRWVLNNALVTGVVAGPRTFEQWEDYLRAPAIPFAASDEAFVERLVPAGHGVAFGFDDPRLPFAGRRPRKG